MKKSRQETAETRRRVLNVAAAEFRRAGINAAGIADLMATAGLTHGGFYRHFKSKDQLVAESCAIAVGSLADSFKTALSKKGKHGGLEAIADDYLSKRHRDDCAGGCPFASLGSELVRSDNATREVATEGFLKLVDIIAEQFPRTRPEAARGRALVALSAMIGAVTMSRLVTDPELSGAILSETKERLAKF
jgi:TetR/AcrR family transcriptional regulator, transcriptional repressor for nem operon